MAKIYTLFMTKTAENHTLWGRNSPYKQFSSERRKTKTKAITLANHKGHRQKIYWNSEDSNQVHEADVKRMEMCANKAWLVLVSNIFDWLRNCPSLLNKNH